MFTKEDKESIARCIGFIVSSKRPVSRLFGISKQAHHPTRMSLFPRASWRMQVACDVLKSTGWFSRLCVDRAKMLGFVSGTVLDSHGGVQ